VLAAVEVVRFDLALRVLDRAVDHAVLNRHVLFHAQPLHQAGDALGPEDAQQIVFQRQVEPTRSGITLTTGATTQLVVDAARLVTLGAQDVQTARFADLLLVGLSGLAMLGQRSQIFLCAVSSQAPGRHAASSP
jgi:hypothetical protein